MEIVDEVRFIDGDEVLFAASLVFGCLPEYFDDIGRILHLLRAQQTMVETIDK